MSVRPENDTPNLPERSLDELIDLYEDARDASIGDIPASDNSEQAEKLLELQDKGDRTRLIEYLGIVSGSGELDPDEHDEAYERFDDDMRELFGSIAGHEQDGQIEHFRLGSVRDGALSFITRGYSGTHGSFMNDTELLVQPRPDNTWFIVKSRIEHAKRTGPFDPDEVEIQVVRDAIEKFREITKPFDHWSSEPTTDQDME